MDKEAIYKRAKANVKDLPCPGSKIRSGGRGRGLGIGRGRGPIGVPIEEKLKALEAVKAKVKTAKKRKSK